MDTSTFRGRWVAANQIAGRDSVDPEGKYDEDERPSLAVKRALRFWGNPTIGESTRKGLERYAAAVGRSATEDWQQGTYRALRQNALRLLIATSPDLQTS